MDGKATVTAIFLAVLLLCGEAASDDRQPSDGAPGQQIAYETADNHVRPPVVAREYPRPNKRYNPCETTQTREDHDLCQQWRMAEAAATQASWTQGQFWVTLAEVAGLVFVVIFTGITAKDAARSAKAAEDAVDVNRISSERQLRAYLTISETSVEWGGPQTLEAVIVFQNTGQTPAYDVHHAFDITIGEPDSFDIPKSNGPPVTSDIGAGSPMTYRGKAGPLSDESWLGVRNRKIPLYVWGEIRYYDVFRREVRRTNYRLTLAHHTIDALSPCQGGNKSD